MRIRWVKAIAFGGLVDQTLTLREGLNVVVGPNESGKSTWHAALLAALCGRSPELDSDDDSEFDRRPWHGSGWAVEAVLDRDHDHPVLVYQDLLNPVSSTATELSGPADGGRHDISDALRYGGGLDTTAWVGLDRQSYAATAWVQQGGGRNELSEAVALCIREDDAAQACARIDRLRRRHVGDDSDLASPLGRAEADLVERSAELMELRELNERHDSAVAVFGQWSAFAHTKRHELAVAELAAAQEGVVELQGQIRKQEYDPFAKPDPLRAFPSTLSTPSTPSTPSMPSTLSSDDHDRGHEAVVAAERELRSAEQAFVVAARPVVAGRGTGARSEPATVSVAVAHVPPALLEPGVGASVEYATATYDTRRRGGRWRALRQPDGRALVVGITAVIVVAIGVGLAVFAGALEVGAVLAAIGVGLAVVAVVMALRQPVPDDDVPVSPALVGQPHPEPAFERVEELADEFLADESTVELEDRLTDARWRVVQALTVAGQSADLDTVDSALAQYHIERNRRQREELERRARDEAAAGVLRERLLQAEQEVARLAQLVDPNMARPNPPPRLDQARTAYDSAARERDRAAHTRDTTSAALATRSSVAVAEDALEQARHRLGSLRRLNNLLDETYGYLSRSRVGARREIAGALEVSLGRSLPHITDGRYPHVTVDTDFHIRISDPAQPTVDPTRGARSTREQTYLSARVALGEQLSRRRLYGPLLLDDVTSSADGPRVHGLLDLLYRFAQVRQVVVFAHEETVAEWAVDIKATHPNVNLVRLSAVDRSPREVPLDPPDAA